jgi:hypothetical protein
VAAKLLFIYIRIVLFSVPLMLFLLQLLLLLLLLTLLFTFSRRRRRLAICRQTSLPLAVIRVPPVIDVELARRTRSRHGAAS